MPFPSSKPGADGTGQIDAVVNSFTVRSPR